MSNIKFIVLGQPRTGSTLLHALLNQHSKILMFSELFHPYRYQREGPHAIKLDGENIFYDNEAEDAFSFLERAVWPAAQRTNKRAIGFKLFSDYLRAQGTWRLAFRLKEDHPDIKLIHLVRENILDSWVSLRMAELSGKWQIEVNGDRGAFDATPPFFADPLELKMFFKIREAETVFYQEFFAGENYLEINYEALASNPQRVVNSVAEFLSLPAEPVSSTLQKQNIREHAETISNYFELKRYFSSTPFERFFSGGRDC